MAFDLKDKVVLITGGAVGIGAHITDILLEEEVKHVAFLDILEEKGVKRGNELNKKYGNDKVKFYKCDVTQEDQLFGAFQSVLDKYGYIDVVINNAGIMNDNKALYKKEIDINVMPDYYAKTGVKVIAICFGKTETALVDKNNLSKYDTSENEGLLAYVDTFVCQAPESAARSLVEACKRGKSGSTWLSVGDKPVRDITENIQKAYKIFTDVLLE